MSRVDLLVLLEQSQEAGLSPVETIDYLAIQVCEMDESKWALKRGISPGTVSQHKNNALAKVNEWSEKGKPAPECDRNEETD